MADNFDLMNPLHGIYLDFQKSLDTIVIKYSYLAEKYETFDIKKDADLYIMCVEEKDTFFTYRDYTEDELKAAGIKDPSEIAIYAMNDGYLRIPASYRDTLLKNRRSSIIKNYEEKNEYYRKLNGYPPLNTPSKKYHKIDQVYADKYGIDINIPIHRIQDHYNNISSGRGDYLISIIEGVGIIDILKEKYPDEEYLNYIGSKRIDIVTARKAKNFQILRIDQLVVSTMLYDEFINAYEQARDYHVSTIFVREHRDVIPYYDQFIAMCIMCMTLELVINKQFKLGIDRNYYNDYTLRLLYDSYGIPYDMNIDEYTQRNLAQSINNMIQKKSTDSVFHDIANVLGFNNVNIYRYYLTKERKFDGYGVPIIAYTEKFNSNTGELERVPDYQKMYDVYFQKVALTDKDFLTSYNVTGNIEQYGSITGNDPFWWNDENTDTAVWETEYNFVESKYLSIGLSYKMTEIMYESILLFKFLIRMEDQISNIIFSLPKIDENINVSLFDAIILLFCLMSKKHKLVGEIISIPTQVTSVLDYLHNTDGSDEYLLDSFDFNFNLLQPGNEAGQELINSLYQILELDEAEKFMSYIKALTLNGTTVDSVKIINDIFTNIKGLSRYLQYLMTKTSDRKTYEALKEFYNTCFYSKEVKSIFTINESDDTLKRTAKNYFEFLYHHNTELYLTLFEPNFESQYLDYIKNTDKDPSTYTLNDFIYDVDNGTIDDFTYSTLKHSSDNKVEDDLIYYYIDHIISRLEMYIADLKYIYTINDMTTSLDNLLVKLINFFKSFTVDMLGLDVMYVLDLRAENTLKLIDEVNSITKHLELEDEMKTSYADILHLMQVIIGDNNDRFTFYDKMLYNAYITIAKNNDGDKINEVPFNDFIHYIKSVVEIDTRPSDRDDSIDASYTDKIDSISKLIYDRDDLTMHEKIFLTASILLARNYDGTIFNKIPLNDLIHYIEAVIEINTRPSDRDNTIDKSYTDEIDSITKLIYDRDDISLFEKYSLIISILINDHSCNEITFDDFIHNINSICEAVLNPSDNMISFTDSIHTDVNVTTSDKSDSGNLFTDRIAHKYYSE